MKKTISFICLIVCSLIWGTTFIAQDTGMDNIGPYTFNSVRFFVGAEGARFCVHLKESLGKDFAYKLAV
jgi:drug/metabolite transporter (DMT)-like permease